MSVTLIFVYMAKEDDVSTEVPSYFLGGLISGLGNLATSAGSALATGAGHLASAASHIPVVGNVLSGGITSLGNGLGQVVSGNLGGGLNSMYLGADKLLGGVLPGGQSFGAGYLGNLYGQADRALGGYLPNVGGVGATPAQMSGAALNSGGSYGLQPGQVGTSFNGGPMTVGSVNTPLASGAGGMSGWDKLAYGIQGAGLLGSIFSGDKGQAQQAAMMMPNTIQPGAGSGGPIANTVKNDPAMNKNTGVGVGSSRGQDPNKTPGLDQVTSGISDKELLGQIESTRKDIEDLLANMPGIDGQNFSPLEGARRNSGLGMDTEGQSYFSVSGSF